MKANRYFSVPDSAKDDLTPDELLEVASELERSARKIREQVTGNAAVAMQAPKISKGFVMVNLPTYVQKELRVLGHECGIDLRGILAITLKKVWTELKVRADIKRKTGLAWEQQHLFFSGRPMNN